MFIITNSWKKYSEPFYDAHIVCPKNILKNKTIAIKKDFYLFLRVFFFVTVANGGAINGLDNEGSTPLQKVQLGSFPK